MPPPTGFTYEARSTGEVVIRHRGRVTTVLRSRRAEAFLADVERGDPQQLMARATGNYKRGNERMSAEHPRHHAH